MKKSETEWQYLSTMPDTAIDMTDNPELGASFFENAKLRMLPISILSRQSRKMGIEWLCGIRVSKSKKSTQKA
jgi:hypothetical protein